MNLMQGLQTILAQSSSQGGQMGAQNAQPGANTLLGGLGTLFGSAMGNTAGGKAGLSGLLGPAAIGGLLGALMSDGAARNISGGALLAGGGAALWNVYKNRMQQQAGSPYAQQAPQAAAQVSGAAVTDQAIRLIRAMVFAAKSDGHIDDKEQQAIQGQLQKLNLGAQAQEIVTQAMQSPLDPSLVANGVQNADEALQLFTVSCAIIHVDQFMEKAYLDGLAQALNIPADIRDEISRNLHTAV